MREREAFLQDKLASQSRRHGKTVAHLTSELENRKPYPEPDPESDPDPDSDEDIIG
jgi:hypothetical protein